VDQHESHVLLVPGVVSSLLRLKCFKFKAVMDVYDLDLRPSSRPPGRLFTGSRCFQSVRQTRRASRGRGTRPVDGSVRGDARDGSGRTTCDRFASTGERAIVKDRRPHGRQLPSADRVVYAANRNEGERRIPRSGSMKPCPCLVPSILPQISLCKKKISCHIKISANAWSTKC
jgi:hypothetical protein